MVPSSGMGTGMVLVLCGGWYSTGGSGGVGYLGWAGDLGLV